MNKQIQDLIQKYAEIYQRFEDFQKTDLLPSGDQKTGVIGEYYAHCYYQSKPGVKSVEYAKSGEAFDLLLKLDTNQKYKFKECLENLIEEGFDALKSNDYEYTMKIWKKQLGRWFNF